MTKHLFNLVKNSGAKIKWNASGKIISLEEWGILITALLATGKHVSGNEVSLIFS